MRDLFHFPRLKEAQKHLSLLETGAANALILSGKRRSGKTRYLLRDLAPLAVKRGFRIAYASFWGDIDQPAAALLHGLHRRLEAGSGAQQIAQWFAGAEKEATITLPMASAAVRSTPKQLAGGAFAAVDKAIGALCGRSSKAILLLDEVQQLGLSGSDAAFVAALRTALDSRSGRLNVVFTGSSESGLNAMFERVRAPFFQFGTRIRLEPLGDAFIAHQKAALEKRNVTVATPSLAAALETLGGRPAYFELFRNELLQQDRIDADSALRAAQASIADAAGWSKLWAQRLTPFNRAVLVALAEGIEQPYSDRMRRRLAALTDQIAPDDQKTQGALRFLQRNLIVQRFGSQDPFSFVDDAFQEWVLSRPKRDCKTERV